MQVSPSANQIPNISITCKSIICIEKATLSTIVCQTTKYFRENHVKKFIGVRGEGKRDYKKKYDINASNGPQKFLSNSSHGPKFMI